MSSLPLTASGASLTLFGCGKMAGAMLSRWLQCGLDPALVTVIRKSGVAPAAGVTTRKNARGLSAPDILMIGIKPQQFAKLKTAIRPLAGPQTLVLSIMAGIAADSLREAFPEAGQIVRLMPNLPVVQGEGIVARFGDAGEYAAAMTALLTPLGHVQPVDDERSFDLVTALTGCGPAFTYRFTAALAAAGERLGIPAGEAETLARLTVAGAASGMSASSEPLVGLAAAVASPGGMTQAGLDILDADGALIQLLTDTLRAARDRGTELAALASD
jgi:pyrroline-5-carboxylate reductase